MAIIRNAVAQREYPAALTSELQVILFVPVNSTSDKNYHFTALTRQNDAVWALERLHPHRYSPLWLSASGRHIRITGFSTQREAC